MIAAWIATILKASRSTTAAAVIPKAAALQPAGETAVSRETPRLPGMRGKRLRLEAIRPWANLAVSRAVVTGSYEMDFTRTRRGDVALALHPPISQSTHEVKTKLVVCGASRPEALVRLEYSLRRPLVGFLEAMAIRLECGEAEPRLFCSLNVELGGAQVSVGPIDALDLGVIAGETTIGVPESG